MLGVILLFLVAYLIVAKFKKKADSLNYAMAEKDRKRKEAIRKAEEERIRKLDEEIAELDREIEELDEEDL